MYHRPSSLIITISRGMPSLLKSSLKSSAKSPS